MVSRTTPIDYTLLNGEVFAGGIEKAKATTLIDSLAAAEYHTAGDLLAADPATFRSSLHNIGFVKSNQDTFCNWHSKELQARDRPLPGPTHLHTRLPPRALNPSFHEPCSARQTPPVPFIEEARLRGPCPPLPHPPRLQGWFGWFVSLNWLNSKMVGLFVGLFVGCAILYVGSLLHGIHVTLKPLAARFEWAPSGLRGKATFGGALLRAAADVRYLWSSFR